MSQVINGDCLEEMKKLPANSIDTVITDPPYGLEFMGKGWDKGVPGAEYWTEALRVAKPGAMLLAFGGTRTYHRLAAAIEDAGWELRDCMMWLYGSGFPKSLDISKAIDKAKGAEREVVGVDDAFRRRNPSSDFKAGTDKEFAGGWQDGDKAGTITAPATDLAREWNGWGTALKPAWEPIIVAMKPLDGTFAENAEKWGVAGINVDGGRIATVENLNGGAYSTSGRSQALPGDMRSGKSLGMLAPGAKPQDDFKQPAGRWPANLLLDEEAAAALDRQTGTLTSGSNCVRSQEGHFGEHGGLGKAGDVQTTYGDSGGASRFFYCAKSSKSERSSGGTVANDHPTVKPIKLMEYLCTLTKTPTGGVVLDPFAGSGTTGVAAQNTGREFVLIEKEPKYYEICQSRLLPD